MKKSIFLIGLIVSIFALHATTSVTNFRGNEVFNASRADGSRFTLNSSSSSLTWKGTKPGGEHTGKVVISEGKLSLEEGKIVSGSFTVDLSTITDTDITSESMNAKLVSHLKSSDFFDVAKYPTARFEILSVSAIPSSSAVANNGITPTHQVTGNLIMKGVTKSISFPAKIDVSKTSLKAVVAPFSINRTDWGVNHGSQSIFAELKDKFIYDEMIISLDLTFNKE